MECIFIKEKSILIDLPIGEKIKLEGKHCIVTEGLDCFECVLKTDNGMAHPKCWKLACGSVERADGNAVYFKEV